MILRPTSVSAHSVREFLMSHLKLRVGRLPPEVPTRPVKTLIWYLVSHSVASPLVHTTTPYSAYISVFKWFMYLNYVKQFFFIWNDFGISVLGLFQPWLSIHICLDEVDSEIERGPYIPVDLRHAHVSPHGPPVDHVMEFYDLKAWFALAENFSRQSSLLSLWRVVPRREKHLEWAWSRSYLESWIMETFKLHSPVELPLLLRE